MKATRSNLSVVAMMVTAISAISCSTMNVRPASHGIHASTNPELIERGRYLVYGATHCASCHGDPERENELRQGHEIPLSGGRAIGLGIAGTVVAPNITSDVATGIGVLSDDMLVRSLRYGVSRHGKPMVSVMSFADLVDDDMRAILSYLRTVAPVSRPVEPRRLSLLGEFGVNFLHRRQAPSEPPPAERKPERTVEYGRYLAHTVANCHGCHTRRSKVTGRFVGPPFAGGMVLEEGAVTFVTPNLTPTATGLVGQTTEQQFIERFRTPGRVHSASPMPWEAYARMTDDDLGAIYRYLRTVPLAETP